MLFGVFRAQNIFKRDYTLVKEETYAYLIKNLVHKISNEFFCGFDTVARLFFVLEFGRNTEHRLTINELVEVEWKFFFF